MSDSAPCRHMMVVGDGLDRVERARELQAGLRTSTVCRQKSVPRLRAPQLFDFIVAVPDDAPTSTWLEAARLVDRLSPVDRVAAFTDKDAGRGAAVAAGLGLPWHDPVTVEAVSDKAVMRAVLAGSGVDDNTAVVATCPADVERLAGAVGYPLICKPARGIRSRGITRIDGPDDIPGALDWGRASVGPLDSKDLIVEKFRCGTEYSVEAVSEDGEHVVLGLTTTHHLASRAEHYIEIGHVVPAPVDRAEHDRVAAAVCAALDALGVRTGVTHTEVIVSADEVHIVETHVRPGGDEIPRLWASVTGVDLVDLTVRQSLGLPVLADVRAALAARSATAELPDYAAIWYACPDGVGRITGVGGVDAARSLDGVVEVDVVHGEGDLLEPIVNSAHRAAFVCAVGDSHDEALSRARAGVGRLSFVVRTRDAGLEQGSGVHGPRIPA
ncbi:ATP-grasp domain-containing protein [Actinophytocola sp. KF-1]